MSLLRAWVSAGESGPLITLSGETDMTTVAELSERVTGQLTGGTRHLTIDASALSFADCASGRVLLLAARTLRQRGGGLVLLRPQRALARVLEIMGADHMITVRGEIERTLEPQATAELPPATRGAWPAPLSAEVLRSPGSGKDGQRAAAEAGASEPPANPGRRPAAGERTECDGEREEAGGT